MLTTTENSRALHKGQSDWAKVLPPLLLILTLEIWIPQNNRCNVWFKNAPNKKKRNWETPQAWHRFKWRALTHVRLEGMKNPQNRRLKTSSPVTGSSRLLRNGQVHYRVGVIKSDWFTTGKAISGRSQVGDLLRRKPPVAQQQPKFKF